MKTIGYHIFAFVFNICRIFPLKSHQIFCIMTHDASEGSNVGVVIEGLKRKGDYQFIKMTKDDRTLNTGRGKVASLIHFFIRLPYQMARSSYILQDNIFLPMAYMRIKKSVKVVQLWHGTGTIKKFGQSCNQGELLELEKKADRTITHLVINSSATAEVYKEAFGVDDSKLCTVGLPRTDILFNQQRLNQLREEFYEEYPELRGKKLLLYAPTFRDEQVENPALGFEPMSVIRKLPQDVCILLKLHPFVAKKFENEVESEETIEEKRIYDFSMYENLNTLLAVSDVLITDYSSIIFEYCVLEKPIVFYAYDYEEFLTKSRGFYLDYKRFVPGPIAYNEEQLVHILEREQYDLQEVRKFKYEQYRYFDGKSASRLIQTIFL